MLIDSHAHLLSESLDYKQIINDMASDNLQKIITIGTTIEDSEQSVLLASKYDNIYCTVGIYPEYASSVTDKDLEKLDELASNKKVVAIGEIGLDYHGESVDKECQKQVLVKQIQIAKKHNKPICIHTRGAKEDTYEVLKENIKDIKLPSIIHCFSEDREYALKFIELGFYISFSGNITFKKADRSFLKDLPLDKIIVETDSPYLSPEPLRGRVNQPKNVNITALKIADTLQMDFEEFCKATVENTNRVFFK